MTALLWALLTACIWGVVPLIEKLGLTHSDPMAGVVARSVGVMAGALLMSLMWSPWKALGHLPVNAFVLLALGGLLASVVGQLAFYHALKHGPISQITPVAGAYPLIAGLLGWWLLREPMGLIRWLGVLLIIGGIWLLRR